VSWGDGKRTTVEETSPRDGYIFVASHQYAPASERAYETTETGSVLAGSCTTRNGHEPFQLLSYVALGDSYSSGTGAAGYLPGTGFGFQGGSECLRSRKSFSELADRYLGDPSPNKRKSQTFIFRACNGAVINSFMQPQVTAAKVKVSAQLTSLRQPGSVGLVTFSIGGNDALFASVMRYCATRTKKAQSCKRRWSNSVDSKLAVIEPRLVKLYEQVKSSPALAFGGRVLVLGYPRFFPKGQSKQCPTGAPFHHFLPSDMGWINSEILRLDTKIQQAAKAAQITYVDTYPAFAGHQLCDKNPYLNYVVTVPLAAGFVESYHPNAKGQSVFASLIERLLKRT
jgi:lysophospholipase L1-like esterase